MNILTPPLVMECLGRLKLRPNLRRRIRMSAIANVPDDKWVDRGLYALPSKDGQAGVQALLRFRPTDIHLIQSAFCVAPT